MPRGRYLVGGEVEEFACAAGPAGWRYTSVRPGSGLSVDLTLDSHGRQYRVELASAGWVLRGGCAGTSVLWLRRPAGGAQAEQPPGDAPPGDAAGGALPGEPAGGVPAGQPGSGTLPGNPPGQPPGDAPAGQMSSGVLLPGEPPGQEAAGRDAAGLEAFGRDVVGRESLAERSAVAHGFFGDSPGFCVAVARLLRLAPGQSRRLRLVEVTGPALATRLVDLDWRCVAVQEHTADGATVTVCRYDAVPVDTGEVRTAYLAGDVVVAADSVELLSLDAPPGGST